MIESKRQVRPGLRPWVGRLGRRLNLALWLVPTSGALVVFAGVYATAAIFAKRFWPEGMLYLPWTLLIVPLIGFVCWHLQRRRGIFFTESELIEWMDHHYANDGAIVSDYERPGLAGDPDFEADVLVALAPLMPRYDFVYFMRKFTPVMLYGLLAWWVPVRPEAQMPNGQYLAQTLTEPLVEQVEDLQMLLPEPQIEELTQALEQIAEDTDGISREQWEALEELKQRVEDAAAQAGREAAVLERELSRIDQALGAASTQQGAAQQEQTDEALEQALKALQQLSQSGASGQLSDQMRQQLDKLMRECKACQGGKSTDELREQLQKMLSQCKGKSGDGDEEGFGKGGIGRGRGDAPMVIGDPREITAKFEDGQLMNRFLAPQDMVDMGITLIEPKPDPGRFSPGVVRQHGAEQGTQVNRTRISPGQRQVISDYFSE